MSSIDTKKRVRDLLKGTKAANGYYGFPDLIANTDNILEEIYDGRGYTSEELTAIKTWYAGQVKFPVLNEFPRTVKDLPAFFVFRASNEEMKRGAVGDFLLTDEDQDTSTTATEIYGSYFEENIAIHLWAIGAYQRDDLFIALRELLLRGRLWFDSCDMMVEIANGKDGQLYDPQAEPQIIHRAEIALLAKSIVSYESTGTKITEVTSRAVDPVTGIGEVDADEYFDER